MALMLKNFLRKHRPSALKEQVTTQITPGGGGLHHGTACPGGVNWAMGVVNSEMINRCGGGYANLVEMSDKVFVDTLFNIGFDSATRARLENAKREIPNDFRNIPVSCGKLYQLLDLRAIEIAEGMQCPQVDFVNGIPSRRG